MALSSAALVQIETPTPLMDLRPSQFNSRTTSSDGTLLLFNSYSGAFSGFPPHAAGSVTSLLRKNGLRSPVTGMVKYLYERGYLVESKVNELDRSRIRYSQHQHRPDELELILLTSEECNFRCVYCYETFPRGTMLPPVRRGVLALLNTMARRLNRLNISYFGGEPLLGLEAIDEIAPQVQTLCADNGITFHSSMTTNGYLLTPEVSERLIRWGITGYQITLDGPAAEHDKHRPLAGGGPTFSTVLSNILALARTDSPCSVALRVNFDQGNKDSVDQLLQALDPLKGDSRFALRFYPVGKWGGKNDEALDVCGTSGQRVRHELDLLAISKGFQAETKWHMMRPDNPGNVCYAARPNNFIIGADGKIMKCTIELDTQDHNILGKIHEDGKMEVDVDKLAKWTKPYFEDDAVCKKCFHLPLCHGSSCPLPRIEDGSRPCPSEKTEIARTLRSLWEVRRTQGNAVVLS